ncbi:HAD hydrolase-like protein [Candidatus Woesearchaeota archaeon]|nr:HAD hydrolase-like protein [Candidatus Woesearchaeota archaeon]
MKDEKHKMIRNMIFDWSGTLSDDIMAVYRSVMGVFRRFGLESISLERFRQEFRLPYKDWYHKYIPDANMAQLQRMFEEELAAFPRPKLYPGVKDILEYLENKNINIVMLSAHVRGEIEAELRDSGFQDSFLQINAPVFDKRKAIREVLESNSFRPEETAYVGDMLHDIETAKLGGVRSVAITWGYHPKELLQTADPDIIIDDISELKDLV